LIKRKPNRKPFPKGQAVFSRCGMRCDLCVHYTGGTIGEELRAELKKRLIRVYAGGVGDGGYWGDDMMLCVGGHDKQDCGNGCPGQSQYDCAKGKGLEGCSQCRDFPCGETGIVTSAIEAKSTSADDITLAILPYVDGQYGN